MLIYILKLKFARQVRMIFDLIIKGQTKKVEFRERFAE